MDWSVLNSLLVDVMEGRIKPSVEGLADGLEEVVIKLRKLRISDEEVHFLLIDKVHDSIREYVNECLRSPEPDTPERLKGALQNVGLEVILKAGRADAEYSARLLGAVDPMSVKHTVENQAAEERTHPTFFPLLEQWEQHAQAIQRLRVGEAFVRLPTDTVHRVRTPTLPRITVAPERLAAVREHYLHASFSPS